MLSSGLCSPVHTMSAVAAATAIPTHRCTRAWLRFDRFDVSPTFRVGLGLGLGLELGSELRLESGSGVTYGLGLGSGLGLGLRAWSWLGLRLGLGLGSACPCIKMQLMSACPCIFPHACSTLCRTTSIPQPTYPTICSVHKDYDGTYNCMVPVADMLNHHPGPTLTLTLTLTVA